MNKLLKDAIADAKAVRETALANAKVALEEAFAPKLQSMLSHKIKEEMEEEGEEVHDEEAMEVAKMQKMAGIVSEEDEDMEEPAEEPAEEEFESEEEFTEEPAEEEAPEEEDFNEEPADDDLSDEDLEEILRELDSETEEEETMEESEDPEAYDMKDEGKKKNKMMEEEEAEDEEVDLDEIINALREEDEAEEKEEEKEESMDEVHAELNEAYGVIKYLRSKLNEVNLLNAKLLFVNKLFRKGELTEAQKVKIIETFDRAKNVREAKLIYATLSESVNKAKAKVAAPKKRMTEGLASAPQKKTQIISESNDIYSRFKTLVDYNSNNR